MNLKLTLNRSSLDVGCDQGYGSERSPEEDFPPNLTVPHKSFQGHLKTSHKPKWITNKISEREFDFIKEGGWTAVLMYLYQCTISLNLNYN